MQNKGLVEGKVRKYNTGHYKRDKGHNIVTGKTVLERILKRAPLGSEQAVECESWQVTTHDKPVLRKCPLLSRQAKELMVTRSPGRVASPDSADAASFGKS